MQYLRHCIEVLLPRYRARARQEGRDLRKIIMEDVEKYINELRSPNIVERVRRFWILRIIDAVDGDVETIFDGFAENFIDIADEAANATGIAATYWLDKIYRNRSNFYKWGRFSVKGQRGNILYKLIISRREGDIELS